MKQELAKNTEYYQDDELVQRASDGDQEACQIIVGQYEGLLLGYVVKNYVSDYEQAKDLVQEVFLKFFLKIDQYSKEKILRPYLLSITKYHCIDWLRTKKNFLVQTVDDEDLASEIFSSIPAREVDREAEDLLQERRILIERCLSDLSINHQKVLRLVHYKGLSYQQAAEQLSVPIGTIKSRVHTGVKQLKAKVA